MQKGVPMADIVTISAYRSAHRRIVRNRSIMPTTGPATLLLFTGVRREPIAAPSRKADRPQSRPGKPAGKR